MILGALNEVSRSELLTIIEQLSRQSSELEVKITDLTSRISQLEIEKQKLIKLMFSPRTERRVVTPIDARQGSLFGDEIAALEAKLETKEEPIDSESSKQKPKRRPSFPKHLPREVEVCELPEDQRRCSCGSTLVDMGADVVTEVLERIDFALVHEIRRKKYCCRGCQSGVTVAPGPTRIVEKGILGNSFIASLLVDRYQHHMPFHRQETKLTSEGLSISRSVLCEAARHCSNLLAPVFAAHQAAVLSSDYLKADETHVILKDSSKPKGSSKAYLWAYLAPKQGVVFDFDPSRSSNSPSTILRNYSGFLQIDGYSSYNEVCSHEGVIRCGCWAHMRRKFIEAEEIDEQFAQEALRLIGRIYDLDRISRDEPPDLRNKHRNETIPPELDRLRDWLELRLTQVLIGTPIHQAIQYALGQWPALIVFLKDGRIDLDNNTVEQQLRHAAVGRKNWMHLENENGGERTALFYSLIQSCKLLKINPRDYLFDVLIRAKEGADPQALIPARWKADRDAAR